MNKYLKNLNRIEFVVTMACTGKCKHCSQGDHTGSENIDKALAADAVRKIAAEYNITSVMTYCAITGKRAIDMPYEFCANHLVNNSYNSITYIHKNYSYDGATTNYTVILESEEEMTALRAMIDKYLKEKPYLNYE